LKGRKWVALAFVCNDLHVFSLRDSSKNIDTQSAVALRDITKKDMALLLVEWRLELIHDQGIFDWPFFTPRNIPPPNVPWASSSHPLSITRGPSRICIFTPEERLLNMDNLVKIFSRHSAYGVGHIHRTLQQPLIDNEQGLRTLQQALNRRTEAALKFVCIDVGCLPGGRITKQDLIDELIAW
ncbi:hypothetical protein C8R42DRAFT_554878, partial [Lentinula raphanica]